MDLARELAAAGAPEGTTVLAREQTGGQGRRGRSWFSPPGGVYFSTLLRPPWPPRDRPKLALLAGVAVVETVHELGAKGVGLKWPNDVIVGRKKLGGILLHGDGDWVLIGVGLNRVERGELELPEEVQFRYMGLADLIDPVPGPRELARAILARLETCYREAQDGQFERLFRRYRDLDGIVGQKVCVTAGATTTIGVANGIDGDGMLELLTENGVERVGSGEVERVGFQR